MAHVRLSKLFIPLLLGLLGALGLGALPALAAPETWTAFRCGRLLDPASGQVTAGAVVLVRGERVEKVGAGVVVPAGAREVDLSSYTCLPGLIDSHTHVLLQPEDEVGPPPVLTKSQAFRTVQGVAAARKDLEAGFTTMRDLDSEGAGFADVAIRDGINGGFIPGPRLLVATLALTITGGHMNNSGLNPDIQIPEPATLADSTEAMVAEGPARGEVWGGLDQALCHR
jgi:imidazolonepropionase-like amidohydrolase